MNLRWATSKPRGLLRDVTILTGLILFAPDFRFMAVGTGILLLGLALHLWSKGCLIRNWTVTTSGPYRLVRHPFYLANFFIDEGVCVISGNTWLTGVYFVAFLLVYLPTIRKEEESLIGTHGDTYRSFARKVPALVPYRIHAIFGPMDFAWENVIREKELSRVLRIIAIPSYFVVVGALFHGTTAMVKERLITLSIAAAVAIVLNVGSTFALRYERVKRLTVGAA